MQGGRKTSVGTCPKKVEPRKTLSIILTHSGYKELLDAIKSKDGNLFSPETTDVYPFLQSVYPGSDRNLNYRSTIDLTSGDLVATLLQYVLFTHFRLFLK